GRPLAEPPLDPLTDPRRHLLSLPGGGALAGADGPDRLVGDRHVTDLLRGQAGQRGGQLALQDGPGPPLLPLLPCLPDAEDRPQPSGEGRARLPVDELVVLSQEPAAFAVADKYVAAAQVEQHLDAGFAGDRAFLFGVDVLSPQRDRGAPQLPRDQ